MILRQTFVNKIRTLGYEHKSETQRVHMFRKPGTGHFISVPKKEKVTDKYVRSALGQAGLTNDEIESFLGLGKS